MNKSVVKFGALVFLSYLPFSHAAQPKTGDSVDGGIFLYREPVESYWNDWVAHPLQGKDKIRTLKQAHLTVIGEGKTATFTGNLSINCENGKHYWKSAESGSESLTRAEAADEIVPKTVIQRAVKLFCKN
jgi:hypothetical protein